MKHSCPMAAEKHGEIINGPLLDLGQGLFRRGYVASYAIFILIGACRAAASPPLLVFINSTPGAIHRRARERKSSAGREAIDVKKTELTASSSSSFSPSLRERRRVSFSPSPFFFFFFFARRTRLKEIH